MNFGFGSKSKDVNNEQASGSNLYLSALVESSSDAIIGKTLDGEITYWNKGAEATFGYSADEAIGQAINMLAADERDEHSAVLAAFQNGQPLEQLETRRKCKDGSIFDV